jgi:hypothetical protein
MDQQWLDQCLDKCMPVPPFDRYIYILPQHVVKKRLQEGETGFDGYVPELSTLKKRDDNELHAMKLVEEYTSIPVPKLVHAGDGYVILFHKNYSPSC